MTAQRPQVLYEDNHLLVVDKPTLLPTMGVSPDRPSLYRWAASYLKEKYDKPGNVYVGIVSRLDAFVSGVIVLARTSKAASRLSDQLRRGVVKKNYVALVNGGLNPESGTLEDYVYKDEIRHRMCVASSGSVSAQKAKLARLRYHTIMKKESFQAIQIELETGRKHQIRVQLENTGHPVVGDKKYGSQMSFASGIALHCFQLTFEHPTKKTLQSFHSTPPESWPIQLDLNYPKRDSDASKKRTDRS